MEKLGITLPFHTYPLVVGADIDDMFRLMTLMDLGWKRAFGLRHYEVLGLDIGSSEVKIVQLHKHNGEYAVTAAGVVEIPANIDNNSQREENTTEAIRECLEQGMSARDAARTLAEQTSLPRKQIYARVIQLRDEEV